MANKIQFKRGVKANLPILSVGEPALCTDTNQIYVGNGASNIELAKASDLLQMANLLKVTKNYNVSLANDTTTQIKFDNVISYNNDFLQLQADGTVKVIKDGLYEICVSVGFNGNSNGIREVSIGAGNYAHVKTNLPPSGFGIAIDMTFLEKLNSNDIITVNAKQTSGSALDVLNSTIYTFLTARRIG